MKVVSVGFISNFQLERRKYPHKQPGRSVFVLTDDDCLPEFDDVQEALEVLNAHPAYAILSAFPSNEKINEWTPDLHDTGYTTASDSAVMEHVSVGGLRFMRKGLPKGWPPLKGNSYDKEHAEALRRDGLRVGYFRYITHQHLGKGSSTIYASA